MPQLRKHRRRNRKARAPRARKRRNLVKFIPSSDSDFALTANNFAMYLAAHADACGVSDADIAEISEAVSEYRHALSQALHRRFRTQDTIDAKNIARKRAEEVIRRHANIIRANPEVSAHHKKMLRIKERPKRSKARKCPQRPPWLRFIGSGDGVACAAGIGGGSGFHVLQVWYRDESETLRRARPDGAVRVELFVDLVPAGEPVPKSPMDRVRSGRGWPWYLRSFTKNPIEVEFPLPAQPMLVCYWARWADSAGEVSRFSNTCVARIEGWTPRALPEVRDRAEHEFEAKFWVVSMPYVLTDDARELRALGSDHDGPQYMAESAPVRLLETRRACG